MPIPHLPEHKKPDFVLERGQNQEKIAVSDTKMAILCSKSPKMGVPKAKSAQKCRFCARNARKRGFRRLKAHKNGVFVLEMPENEGSEGLCAHGLCGRVANSTRNGYRLAGTGRGSAWGRPRVSRGRLGGRCSDTEQKQKRVTAKCHPRLFVV